MLRAISTQCGGRYPGVGRAASLIQEGPIVPSSTIRIEERDTLGMKHFVAEFERPRGFEHPIERGQQ